MSIYADRVFVNGNIYTVNDNQKWATAIAIKNTAIIYIGDDEGIKEFIGSGTEVLDLDKKMVLPGFIDSHAHPLMGEVQLMFDLDLFSCETLEGYLSIAKNHVEKNPNTDFILGVGWSNTVFSKQGPLSSELDKITTDIPVAFNSADYHSIWANSKAIELAGIDRNTPDPDGGVIERLESGEPSGTFRENAQELIKAIIPEHTVAEYRAALKSYQEKMIPLGITFSYEAWMFDESNMLKAYRDADAEKDLLINFRGAIAPSPVNPEKGVNFIKTADRSNEDNKFQINHIKLFIDGVVEGYTALLKEPYSNSPQFKGNPIWKNEDITQVAKLADEFGWDLHLHVIGDAAVDQMLTLLENLENKNGPKDRRPIAAHIQIVDPEDLSRLKKQNVIFSSNPFWQYKAPGYFDLIEVKYLGEDRANKEYPMNSIIKNNIRTAAGSDYPISIEPDPLLAIQIGTTRCDPDNISGNDILNPEERVSLEDMIKCCTINGAYANRMEKTMGSLETGKKADLVILEKNLFDVPVQTISDVKVAATMTDGNFIFKAKNFSTN